MLGNRIKERNDRGPREGLESCCDRRPRGRRGLVSAPVTATAVSSVPTITWSNHVQTAPTGSWGRGDGWSSVAYGNGKFIAVGATTTTGAVSVSSDG